MGDRIAAKYSIDNYIGRRFLHKDKINTPFAVTIDHQPLDDGTVTLRDRDSLEQVRVPVDDIGPELERRLGAEWRSPKLG